MGMFDHLPDAQPAAPVGGGMFDHLPAAVKQAPGAPPQVPAYMEGGSGNVYDSPEALAQLDASHQAQTNEQAAFDASRTLGKRAADTGAFALSLPVRMATKGEYGAGDVAGLVAPQTANALNQGEGGFARANQKGLEAVAAAGDVMAGVPILSSMGAVPGQVMRTGAAAVGDAPRQLNRLLRDDRGAGINPLSPPPSVPSGGAGGPTPPVAPPAAGTAAQLPPTKGETIAAGERIGVPIFRAVTGNETEKALAGGLSAIPYAGAPLTKAYKTGVQKLGDAAARTTAELGNSSTADVTGQAAKQGILDWIGGGSKKITSDLYDAVDSNITNRDVTRPLSSTAAAVEKLSQEQAASATTHNVKAIGLVQEALDRPEGLTYDGVKGLRTVLGSYIDGSVLPEPGTSMPAIKRLYGALTEDLQGTIRQAGGEVALTAWQEANTAAKTIAGKREQLAKIVGIKGEVPAERVIKRLSQMASGNAGDIESLRLAKQTLGNDNWGDVAATIASHYGIDPSTNLFSGDRFLTAYGKLSDPGKAALFGGSKQAFDDIALVASKYRDLSRLGNASGTGRVNAVMKIITHPTSAVAGAVGGALNPVAGAAVAIPGMMALRGGRSLAWYLAKPQVAGKAGGLIKAYYGVERAFNSGANVIAAREQGLSNAIRSFSLSVARATGGDAKAIEADLAKQINDVRQASKGNPATGTWTSKTVSVDEMEAAIVELTNGPDGASMAELRKKFPDISKAEFNRTLKEMRDTGRIDLGKRIKP